MTAPSATAARVGLEYTEVDRAVGAVAALDAAEEIGLLAALDTGPSPVPQLAASCGVSERGLTALLDALAALGIVHRDGRLVANDLPPGALREHRRWWRSVTTAVRTGEPTHRADQAATAGRVYPGIVDVLAAHSADAAERAATALARPGLHVLDLGCGAAPWSRAVAHRHPDVTLTLVDLPPVLDRTRAVVRDDGLADRTQLLPGDAFTLALPEEVDLVVLASVLHLFDEPRARQLLDRAAGVLAAGGRLAIIEPAADAEDDPVRRALYSLSLFMRTSAGRLHSLANLASWLRETGLQVADRVELGARGPDLLIARTTDRTWTTNTT